MAFGGTFDLVEHVSSQVPVRVLCRLLDVDDERAHPADRVGRPARRAHRPRARRRPARDAGVGAVPLVPFRSPAALEVFEYGRVAGGAAPGQPRQRPRHDARDGDDRRRAAPGAGLRQLLPAARARRAGDDPAGGVARGADARSSTRRRWRACRNEPGAAARAGAGRVPALGSAGLPHASHGDPGRRIGDVAGAGRRQDRAVVSEREPRRDGRSPTPTCSTSTARASTC